MCFHVHVFFHGQPNICLCQKLERRAGICQLFEVFFETHSSVKASSLKRHLALKIKKVLSPMSCEEISDIRYFSC